eukprot:1519604-Rhodomonas_salina.1
MQGTTISEQFVLGRRFFFFDFAAPQKEKEGSGSSRESSTVIGHAATVLWVCYAMSGTDIGCAVSTTRSPVLRESMPLRDVRY